MAVFFEAFQVMRSSISVVQSYDASLADAVTLALPIKLVLDFLVANVGVAIQTELQFSPDCRSEFHCAYANASAKRYDIYTTRHV